MLTEEQLLVDQLGALGAEIKRRQEEYDKLKEKINTKEQKIEGLLFKCTVFEQTPTLIDKDRVLQLLGAAMYATCLKPGKTHYSVRITRK